MKEKDMNRIKLNMDALINDKGTYSSVTDLYDVHIFTDAAMQEFRQKKEKVNDHYSGIQNNVFLAEKQEADHLESTLFLDTVTLSKKQDVTGASLEWNQGLLACGILVFFVFLLGMIRYNTYRTIRRKKDADYGNIYQ